MPRPAGVERARERQADRAIGLEELAGEDRAELAQPAGVVAEKAWSISSATVSVPLTSRRSDAMQADALEVAHGSITFDFCRARSYFQFKRRRIAAATTVDHRPSL